MERQVQCLDIADIADNRMSERPEIRELGILCKRRPESCFRIAPSHAARISQLGGGLEMDVKELRAELFGQVIVIFHVSQAVDHYIPFHWNPRRKLFAEPSLPRAMMYLAADTL